MRHRVAEVIVGNVAENAAQQDEVRRDGPLEGASFAGIRFPELDARQAEGGRALPSPIGQDRVELHQPGA
ncbi:MAG TPA: hypothetical protein VMF04_03795, partial [Thermoplasmata archaeon]|nr:hypothetical protein [Thermoplasmata archaeon]